MRIDEIKNLKKPLIAVHRAKSGGSIIENTIPAALSAIRSGADIIEFDVSKTLDGKIVVFHSNMELKLFHRPIKVNLLPLKIVKKLQLFGSYGGKSGYVLDTLEEYLAALKGKCLLNFDRIWDADVKKCLEIVGKLDMFDQIIIKALPNKAGKRIIKELSAYKNAHFMAIIRKVRDYEIMSEWCSEYGVPLSIVEVVFKTENELSSNEFIERMHSEGKLIWANAINLHKKAEMCAGHGDNVSITSGPDKGWGWLVEKGYDIIQTDWPSILKDYLNSK